MCLKQFWSATLSQVTNHNKYRKYSFLKFVCGNMSQRSQVSKATHSKTTCMVGKKQTTQIPRIKSAILHGKAIPIQSYRGLNLVRFEHVNDKYGAMVVIAEEMPSLRRMVNIQPGVGVSQQAGKFFNVICSYKTSSDCISEDSKKRDKNWRASTEGRNSKTTTIWQEVNTSERLCGWKSTFV